jgi:hypothetical protein
MPKATTRAAFPTGKAPVVRTGVNRERNFFGESDQPFESDVAPGTMGPEAEDKDDS